MDPDDKSAQRVATWSGLRREGVMRGITVEGELVDRIVYARLAPDLPAQEPEGFRALLNSFLPESGRSPRCWSATRTAGCWCAG